MCVHTCILSPRIRFRSSGSVTSSFTCSAISSAINEKCFKTRYSTNINNFQKSLGTTMERIQVKPSCLPLDDLNVYLTVGKLWFAGVSTAT